MWKVTKDDVNKEIMKICIRNVEETISYLSENNKKQRILNIFSLTDDPSAKLYMDRKVETGKKYDVPVIIHSPENKEELIKCVKALIKNKENRIIFQKPFDESIWGSLQELHSLIPDYMDVDGFGFSLIDIVNTTSWDDIMTNPRFSPTAKGVFGIMHTLTNGEFKGNRVAVIGKGLTSGLPIGVMASQLGCSVRWANSSTEKDDLKNLISNSNFVISCTGRPNLINADYAVDKDYVGYYINVGMYKTNDKWYGDIDFKQINELSNTMYCNTLFNSTGKLTTLYLILNTLL